MAAEALNAGFGGPQESAVRLYSVGTLIAGLAMLKGVFSKYVACLGLVSGILGIAFGGLGVGPFFFIWIPLVGYKLS
jgi:hypothetical protein